MTSRTKVGLYGGTFDPFHNDHLRVANSIVSSGLVDRLIIIPGGTAPHKITGASANHRWAMAEMATLYYPKLEVVRWETDLPAGQPCFTVDTMVNAREILGRDVELNWVIGADALAQIDTWDDYDLLFRGMNFIAVSRDDLTESWLRDQVNWAPQDKISWLDVPTFGISSTQIREAIKAGSGINHLVNPNVDTYIRKYKLYEQTQT